LKRVMGKQCKPFCCSQVRKAFTGSKTDAYFRRPCSYDAEDLGTLNNGTQERQCQVTHVLTRTLSVSSPTGPGLDQQHEFHYKGLGSKGVPALVQSCPTRCATSPSCKKRAAWLCSSGVASPSGYCRYGCATDLPLFCTRILWKMRVVKARAWGLISMSSAFWTGSSASSSCC